MRINNSGKFYQYSIYGRQVKNFKILHIDSALNTNCSFFGGEGVGEGRGFELLLKLEVVFKQIKLMFE